MLLIVLLVCYVVVMLLWGLATGGPDGMRGYSPWLGFLAVLILGIVVFVVGNAATVWKGP